MVYPTNIKKCQVQILYIFSYTKMKKNEKIWRCKNRHTQILDVANGVSQNYLILRTFVKYTIGYIWVLFKKYLKLINIF